MLVSRALTPMHRKDDNPRPPSAGGALAATPDRGFEDEVTSPSGVRAAAARPAVSPARPPPPLPPLDPTPRAATPVPASLADPRIGETLVGRYRLDRLIGKGGMGRVYRATQFPLNRPVAVKILNPEFQKKDPQFVRRFFLEAASAARLSHPNTITVFDYGEAESGELFIAMELLQGRPLSRLISSEGPFSGARAVHVAMQICRALREAHAKGIIHRDLKPGNILLLAEGDDGDFVKVLDFGLVKLFNITGEPEPDDPLTPEPPNELTKAGMFLGSPKYMSPEQIQGASLDPRTDIYSLGVLMFHMVTGKPPFGGATSVEVIYKHVNQPVPTFASLGVDTNYEVEEVIHRCLAKHRDDRFESMNALLGRLKDVQRLLTGVSAASETGIDVDLSEFSGAGPRASIIGPPSMGSADLPVPPLASLRPQTHPMRATPSSSGMPFVSGDTPFVDTGSLDDTGSGALLQPGRGASRGMARIAPWLAGLALVSVLGVLAYVMTRRDPGLAPTQDPAGGLVGLDLDEAPAPAPRATVKVTFTSDPSGASVFDTHGLSLGRTPVTSALPRPSAGAKPQPFLFKLDGHAEATRLVTLEGDDVEVSVKLTAQSEPAAAPQGEEDYKENPY